MTSAAADARYNPPRYQSATGSASQPLQLRHSRRHIVSGLRGSTGLDKVTSNEIGTAEGLIASISRRGGDQVGDTIERQLTIEDKEKGLLEEVWVPDDEWYPEGGWRAWKVVLVRLLPAFSTHSGALSRLENEATANAGSHLFRVASFLPAAKWDVRLAQRFGLFFS